MERIRADNVVALPVARKEKSQDNVTPALNQMGASQRGEVLLAHYNGDLAINADSDIDLAPLVKGMGSKQSLLQLAERYRVFATHSVAGRLAREIALAKAWIVTEVVLLLHERKKSDFKLYLSWYREHLPGWLDESISLL